MSQENAKAIEKANAYREMMNSWAWRNLQEIIQAIKNDAQSEIHRCPIDKLSTAGYFVARMQGIMTGFEKMESAINYIIGAPEITK